MKKAYETPEVEVVKFQYRDQVVAASGGGRCTTDWKGNMSYAGGCEPAVIHVQDQG